MQGQARVITYDARTVIPLLPTEHDAIAGHIAGQGTSWAFRPVPSRDDHRGPYLGGGGGGLGVPVVS
jgi:hypothetical protein